MNCTSHVWMWAEGNAGGGRDYVTTTPDYAVCCQCGARYADWLKHLAEVAGESAPARGEGKDGA